MSITCIDCPSFLRKDEASSFFGITAGGPMCARFGWVLGHDDEVAVAANAKYSSSCSARGNARPTSEISAPASFGATYKTRPELLEDHGDTPSFGPGGKSCLDCRNFDTKAQACAAIGKTIFPERRHKESDGCRWAWSDGNGALAHEAVGPILEHLTGDFVSVAITPKAPAPAPKPPKAKGPVKWPNAYDSDAPIAEEDKDMIRAYRRVDTRQGPVYLPIFHSHFFGERADLIPDPNKPGASDPSLYIDHAGVLERFAVITYKLDMNLMFVGEPGTGKTEAALYLAWMMNMPFERLAYNEASEPDQFLGSPQYGDTGKVDNDGKPIVGTYFEPGLLPQGWMRPGVLLSDEINLPQEAIQQAYRSMLDSSRTLTVYNHRFPRHDYCFHLSAINPSHDFRNIGARPMASADSSRWVFMHMPNPSSDMVRKVLTTTVERLEGKAPDPFMITTIIKIGEELRQLSRDGKLPDFWTLRQEVKVARLIPFFGLLGAYAAAYTDFVDDPTRELVETCIRSYLPSGTDWAD